MNFVQSIAPTDATIKLITLTCCDCGVRPRNTDEALQLNEYGICTKCLANDHLYSDYADTMRSDTEEIYGEERDDEYGNY